MPKVSILWINYNSSKIINVVLDSLKAICELEYPKDEYELIVVDNGSTDESFNLIKKFLDDKDDIRRKVIRVNRNLGFAGGCNLAYRLRDHESKYVVLLNNDAIPTSHSLKAMIEFMEDNPDIGAVQGIILKLEGDEIDSAGNYMSELLTIHPFLNNRKLNYVPKRPYYITYADGAYSAYRVDAIKRAVKSMDRIFHDIMFAYYDDNVLGLKIWNSGFKIATIPTITARHLRGGTFNKLKPLQEYFSSRGHTILREITNSRYKKIVKLFQLRGIMLFQLLSTLKRIPQNRKLLYARINGMLKGYKIGKKLNISPTENIDIYRSKIILLKIKHIILGLIYLKILRTYAEKYLQKNIHKLYVKQHQTQA